VVTSAAVGSGTPIGELRSIAALPDGRLVVADRLYNVLATVEQYPWREAAGRTPLPANLLEAAKRRWDVGAWNGAVGLYGTRGEVAEARRRLERALRGKVWRLKFLDDRLIRMAPLLARPYRWRTGRDLMTLLGSVLPGYRLHQGVPSEGGLLRPYWRKKAPPPGRFDPDADRCGFIWLTATAPLAPTEVRGMVDIAGSVIAAHGFEPLIGLNALTERCVYGVVGIAYDRDEPGEDDRALRCHDELLAQLTAAGYYPARLGLQSMDAVQGEDTYARLLRTLKDALDPNHILAPGRYVPAPTTPAGGRA